MTTTPAFRRRWLNAGLALSLGLLLTSPQAATLGSNETTKALKEALTRGAAAAVDGLGKPGGFMGNDLVRIPLPAKVQEAEKLMRRFGAAKQADQLIETMNQAAETAVVEAKPLLVQAVRKMTVKDAAGILNGNEDAATQYFRQTTSSQLTRRLRPLIEAATQKVGVAQRYEKFAGQASQLGLLDAKDADLNGYITDQALNGLFLMIAEEEKAIRQDPVATGSAVIKKVFGSLFK